MSNSSGATTAKTPRRHEPGLAGGGHSTPEELSEVLADATGTDPEEIERGAAEFEIPAPEEAEVVGYGEHDGEHGFLADPGDE